MTRVKICPEVSLCTGVCLDACEHVCYLVVYLDLYECVVIFQGIHQGLHASSSDEVGLEVQTPQGLVLPQHLTHGLEGKRYSQLALGRDDLPSTQSIRLFTFKMTSTEQ